MQQREQMDPQYQWDLTTMYPSDSKHADALMALQTAVQSFKSYQGTLDQGPAELTKAIDAYLELSREMSNVYVYAHLKNDQDQTHTEYQALEARASQVYAAYSEATAFFEPELLAIDPTIIRDWLVDYEPLAHYRQFIEDLLRSQAHVLSASEEGLIAQATEIFQSPQKTFGLLNNADFAFPSIQDEEGNEVALTHATYGRLIESPDRGVRQAAFEAFYSVYDQFQHTLAQSLTSQMKVDNYQATVHHFDDARQRALHRNHIPALVYDTLVETIHERIELLHDYVALRQELLGLADLEMYDMYTPLLGEPALEITYDEAQAVVLEALAPMGEQYLAIIRRAFAEGWIDVYENTGKRSGAYSSGSYDSNPYILMNWQDNLNSLYTLVHELGHSVHTYLSNQHQDYVYSHYSIFLAEIASTTNENLLTYYLLERYTDPKTQAYVLNHFLDGVKGTVFRQSQFAEFEHWMHQKDQAGEPLTAATLSEHYQQVNADYYGPAVNSDSLIRLEWSRIPHFYMNYYVYQYATGFAAATAFAGEIAAGNQAVLTNYLTFLQSGSSDYPIAIMQRAGIDMTAPDYLHATLDAFAARLDEFKALLSDHPELMKK